MSWWSVRSVRSVVECHGVSWSVMLNFGEGYFRLSQIQKGNEIRRKQAQIRIPYIRPNLVIDSFFDLFSPSDSSYVDMYQ